MDRLSTFIASATVRIFTFVIALFLFWSTKGPKSGFVFGDNRYPVQIISFVLQIAKDPISHQIVAFHERAKHLFVWRRSPRLQKGFEPVHTFFRVCGWAIDRQVPILWTGMDF